MKKLFDFGKKEDAGEQMQSSYDFVETPEIFKEFKEPSAPAEETNLLKLYTDKASADSAGGGIVDGARRIIHTSSPYSSGSSYKISFKGNQDSDEIDVGEYEPVETEIDNLTDYDINVEYDDIDSDEIDVGEFESMETELSDMEDLDLGDMTPEEYGRELLGAEPMEEMDTRIAELDLDDDGVTDALGMDWDNTGSVDALAFDTDVDGKVDTVIEDLDGNGSYETVLRDLDDDGEPDVMSMDLDGDGIEDITIDL